VKSSKSQAPSSKQTPNLKLQEASSEVFSLVWWEGGLHEDPIVLREEPPKDSDARHPFDLEERTAQFGEAIVRFSKKIPRDPTNNRLIDQLVGCGTSVGANYCEANEAVSKKDFRNMAGRCVKEAKESRFFLRMVVASEPQLAEEARKLYREAKELLLILSSMRRK
jgi:four helix bundle protein